MLTPNRHIWGKIVFVTVLRAAPVTRVDVLLHILSGEVAVVVWLPQVLGVCLAGMTFRHIEITGITRIPVCKLFHEVQVGGGLAVSGGVVHNILRQWPEVVPPRILVPFPPCEA